MKMNNTLYLNMLKLYFLFLSYFQLHSNTEKDNWININILTYPKKLLKKNYLKISAGDDGGPCTPVCAHLTLRPWSILS